MAKGVARWSGMVAACVGLWGLMAACGDSGEGTSGVVPGVCSPACGAGLRCVAGQCVPETTGEKGHTTGGESWSILVYLVGDNDLEPAAVEDLVEMLDVGGSDRFRFVVQVDRAADYSTSGVGNLPDWISAKRLIVDKGSFQEVADLGEVDMADPAVLSDFIDWGTSAFPADRTMLILWNHGAGWVGFGSDEGTQGHPILDLAMLKQGISQGLAAAGKDRFHIIGFDACLMANAETALALAPYGEYLLASEELEPGHGWDYRAFAAVRDNPGMEPVALAQAVLSGFFAQAAQAGTDKDITLSLVDLTLAHELSDALAVLAGALTGSVATASPRIGQSREASTRFGKAPEPQREYHLVDVGDLASRLAKAESTAFSAAQQQVATALSRVVVLNQSGPLSKGATGLTLYFPPWSSLYQAGYDAIAEAAPWRDFLRAYYQGGSQIAQPMDIGGAQNEAQVGWVQGEAVIEVGVTAEAAQSLVSAEVWVGLIDAAAGELYLLATGPADYTGQSLVGSWAGEVVVLSQGAGQVFGFLQVSGDAESGAILVDVPFAYVVPGAADIGYVLRREFLDPNGGGSLGFIYYEVGDDSVGELYPVPGSQLVPILPIATEAGVEWTTLAETPFDALAPIGLTITSIFQDLEPGALIYLEIDAYDYGGNMDFVSGQLAFEGTGPVPTGCGAVTEVGECQGSLLRYCEESQLVQVDCATGGCACGFDEFQGFFDCLCP